MAGHNEHPMAGQRMLIAKGPNAGREFLIEDWWDRVAGKSWMHCDGNPACLAYAITLPVPPLDDEVVYGKIGMFGTLVHVSFLTEIAA